ncbi:MAG: hypothetical protein ABIZ80_00285 [Bryobacteraceae bacterium]
MKTSDRLFQAYRACYQQAFIPIFTEDGRDPKMLVEACVAAGMNVVEYTQRRRDAPQMIPWILENYPQLYVLAGSTIDDDCLVRKGRARFPQLLTLQELAELGVDGFVSMIGWNLESIRRYASTHMVMPTAMTVGEAFTQLSAGAHFLKLQGTDLGLAKRCRQAAAFEMCPIMITGGMNLEQIPAGIAAGGVLIGSGFDLTIADAPAGVTAKEVAEVMKAYVSATQTARAAQFPGIAGPEASPQDWLASLPHHHPF